jgi:hypothetical protein
MYARKQDRKLRARDGVKFSPPIPDAPPHTIAA